MPMNNNSGNLRVVHKAGVKQLSTSRGETALKNFNKTVEVRNGENAGLCWHCGKTLAQVKEYLGCWCRLLVSPGYVAEIAEHGSK